MVQSCLYCVNCTKFGQTPLGSLQRSPDPLAGLRPTSNGKEGKERKGEDMGGREGRGGKEGKKRGGEGTVAYLPLGHLGHAPPTPPPLELRKNLAYGKNGTLDKLPHLFCMFLYYIHIFYDHSVKYCVQMCRKIICCYQMSDFKAKMHQNRFRLGSPQTPLGSLQRSPDT